jgi:hypothetical protein
LRISGPGVAIENIVPKVYLIGDLTTVRDEVKPLVKDVKKRHLNLCSVRTIKSQTATVVLLPRLFAAGLAALTMLRGPGCGG